MSHKPVNPYVGNTKVERFIETIDWGKVESLTLFEISSKIKKLIVAKNRHPRKYQIYFDCIIHNLKKIAENKPNSRRRIGRRDHILKDHAFCRILELVENLDVLDLKDRALEQLQRSEDWEPVYTEDGFIVSITPSSSSLRL